MKAIRPTFLKVFFCALMSILGALSVQAEFIATQPGVLQDSSGNLKVVISYEEPGIFVVLLQSPISLQDFNLDALAVNGASHFFIRFNPELNRYTSIVVGDSELKIRGNLTIRLQNSAASNTKLDKIQLDIDNTNPYLSFLLEKEGQESSILGISGLSATVNKQGDRFAALLQANQMSDYRKHIEAYEFKDQTILLHGEKPRSASLGVELEAPRNICLHRNDVVYLDSTDLDKVKEVANKNEQLVALQNLMAKGRDKDPFKGFLLLRTETNLLVGLRYQGGADIIRLIEPLKDLSSSEFAHACLVREIPL